MPNNVSGNSSSSNNSDNKFDNSFFEQKLYLRAKYIEANIEEDIDSKSQLRIKNLPDPVNIREAASKNYVDDSIDELNLVKNNQDDDFNNHNLTNKNSITLNT